MVVILPDHGTRYLGKIYNDDWMRDHGFMEERSYATAREIIASKNGNGNLMSISAASTVSEAIKLLNQQGISQAPVMDGDNFVGSVSDSHILGRLVENPELRDENVKEVMDNSFPFVSPDSTVDVLSKIIDNERKALLIRDDENKVHIITQHDLLMALNG